MNHPRHRARGRLLAGTAPLPLLPRSEWRRASLLLGLVEGFLRRFLRRPRASLSDQTLAQLRQGPPLLRRLGRVVRFQPRREGLN
ncbi:hypothetical protein [Thermogemmatispora onikobensis]|uniref:hypothetical protein n=1 Tax=Thermogemmatispora onikobensis TaxID=732234 RepID=UPI000852BAB6|nr:hypothetical protein [Thermogemmatispora onikobensis]